MRSLLVLVLLVTTAAADSQIVGRIVDNHHRPLPSVTVTAGKATAHTNANGLYRLVVAAPGTYDIELEYGDVRALRSATVTGAIATLDITLDADGEGVIVIRDPRPSIPPKLVDPHQARRTLPYSDAAIVHDAWRRAWVLLDIDAEGHVARVKLLNKPGYDLDEIAIAGAFDLVFQPGHAATVMWLFEWPAYWWLVETEGVTTALSAHAAAVPCRGNGPLNLDSVRTEYRDCSGPDPAVAATAKWITR